jgi:hypothetical protein
MGDENLRPEQRKTRRVLVKLPVLFRFLTEAEALELVGFETLEASRGETLQRGHTENLSQGGMSLTGELLGQDQHLSKGQKLWLEFSLGDEKTDVPVRAMAVATWSIEGSGQHRKFTAGLMFLGIGQEDLERIGRFVERQGRSSAGG